MKKDEMRSFSYVVADAILCRDERAVCPISPQIAYVGLGYFAAIRGFNLISILLNMSWMLCLTLSCLALAAGPLLKRLNMLTTAFEWAFASLAY